MVRQLSSIRSMPGTVIATMAVKPTWELRIQSTAIKVFPPWGTRAASTSTAAITISTSDTRRLLARLMVVPWEDDHSEPDGHQCRMLTTHRIRSSTARLCLHCLRLHSVQEEHRGVEAFRLNDRIKAMVVRMHECTMTGPIQSTSEPAEQAISRTELMQMKVPPTSTMITTRCTAGIPPAIRAAALATVPFARSYHLAQWLHHTVYHHCHTVRAGCHPEAIAFTSRSIHPTADPRISEGCHITSAREALTPKVPVMAPVWVARAMEVVALLHWCKPSRQWRL